MSFRTPNLKLDKSYSSVSIIFPRTSDYGNEIEFVACPADCSNFSPIMFHNHEQAEEFLLYPENVQLLKDYFQIS